LQTALAGRRPQRLSPDRSAGSALTESKAFAPAKVNLFLHVGAPSADGYHPLCSLMMFANIGDNLSLRPAASQNFTIEGDFGGMLKSDSNNLVVRARDAILAAAGVRDPTFALTLCKSLPIASGLGGGSSDAAAALRLVRSALGLRVDPSLVLEIAATLGSDVPACVKALPVIATGRGDQLQRSPPLPDLNVVLANPGAPSPTGAVYRAYDRAVAAQGANSPAWPDRLAGPSDVVRFLTNTRNDLENAAIHLQPAIGEVLAALSASPETMFARMSGSGATCFALCADAVSASALANRLGSQAPGWWVRAGRLGFVDLGAGSLGLDPHA